MTRNNSKLHWTAVVGVGSSFWLLFWLMMIVLTLHDIQDLYVERENAGIFEKEDIDFTGNKTTLIIATVFALGAAFRAIKRVALLRNGVLRNAMLISKNMESYYIDDGTTSITKHLHYEYKVDGVTYDGTIWIKFGLKKKRTIEIIYNSLNPSYSKTIKSLRARFDKHSEQWRSSMWHVVPRLTLLVMILAGFVALLFNVY